VYLLLILMLKKSRALSQLSSRWPRGTFYLHKLALTLPTGGGRSVCVVRSRTQATELSSV
jgi:hypothetical protein